MLQRSQRRRVKLVGSGVPNCKSYVRRANAVRLSGRRPKSRTPSPLLIGPDSSTHPCRPVSAASETKCRACADEARVFLCVGKWASARRYMAEAQRLWRPDFIHPRPAFGSLELQYMEAAEVTTWASQARLSLQEQDWIGARHQMVRAQQLWRPDLAIDRPSFTTSELLYIDTNKVLLMECEAMLYFRERDWSWARILMASAQDLWQPELKISKPGFTSAEMRHMELNEVRLLASQARHLLQLRDWSFAHIFMLKSQALWRPAMGIGKPEFSPSETHNPIIQAIVLAVIEAQEFLRKEQVLHAEEAMLRARDLWHWQLGIPEPEFSVAEANTISIIKVHHMSEKARYFLRNQSYPSAGEAMRDAQMCWRGRSGLPMPTFSIEEQRQIETIAPSLKLPSRGVLEEQCNMDCAICKDTLPDATSYLLGPCKHAFHEECIATWLTDNSTCPLCRRAWI